jgi:hypothetical protein
MIAETISSLIVERNKSSPPLRPVDIGVMAPWRGQVWKIRERLRALGLSAVDVGTVEVCVHLTVTKFPLYFTGMGRIIKAGNGGLF